MHRVFQLAVLGLVRRDNPSMAAVEDVRLALDEVLLAQAIVEHPRVELDVLSAPGQCRLEVVVHLTDLRVDTAVLAGLVDAVDVVAGQDRTLVRLHRRWPVPDGPGPPARAATP